MKKVSDKLCLSDNSYNGKTSSGFDNIQVFTYDFRFKQLAKSILITSRVFQDNTA